MAHAGTMVGGSAQTNQNGRRWAAIAATVAVVAAMTAGVWLASSTGLAGGIATSAADRSFDQIEAQRGAVTLSTAANPANDAYLNGILGRAHATPYAVTLSTEEYLNNILDRAHATPYAGAAVQVPLSPTSGTFHPGGAVPLPFSATSGTFHPGGAVPPRFSATSLPGWSGP